jgi:hypothetical protein
VPAPKTGNGGKRKVNFLRWLEDWIYAIYISLHTPKENTEEEKENG